jgi:tetratricopeptide (TPR) repeat protein
MRTTRLARSIVSLAMLLGVAVAGGCAAKTDRQGRPAVRSYFDGDLDRAIVTLAPLAEKTDENYVLNNLRLGSAALLAMDLPTAEGAFYRAIEVINAGGVNTPGREFSAYAFSEGLRIWKGEPFERAMASYYLGVVYLLRNDLNNARASFENCLFKLADYGENPDDPARFRALESDFALAAVMLGHCWVKLGRDDLAKANFDRAIAARPDLVPLADLERHRRSNLLLLVDADYGPRRVVDELGQVIGFMPTPAMAGPIRPPRVILDDLVMEVDSLLVPTIDTLALAQRREWRSIDTVRAVKDTLGKGLIVGGAVATGYGLGERSNEAVIGGLAAMALGAALSASAKADLRQWEMVPRTVFVVPLYVEPGEYRLRVESPPAASNRLQLEQTWVGVQVPTQGTTTLYLRLLPWQRGPYRWPTREPLVPPTGPPTLPPDW